MSSNAKQDKLFVSFQVFNKTKQSLFITPECLEGTVTVIDINQQLKNFINMSNQKQKNIKSKFVNNHDYHYDDEAKNTAISTKSQQKLFKIQTSFQRRCQIKAIPYKSQSVTSNNINTIKVLSKVYDSHSQDFDKICTYYALVKPDYNQNNKKDSKQQQLGQLFYDNPNKQLHSDSINSQIQLKPSAAHLVSNNLAPINQELTQHKKSEIQSNQNKADNKIIFLSKEQETNKNLDYNYIKQEQICKPNKLKAINSKTQTLIEKSIHSNNKYRDQQSYLANSQKQKNFNQRINQQNQEKQQKKRKFQWRDPLNLNNDEIQDQVQKQLKNKQIEENELISMDNQNEEYVSPSLSEQQKHYSINQFVAKNNQSKSSQCYQHTDQNIQKNQNFNQSSTKIEQNVRKKIKQSKQPELNFCTNNNNYKNISKLNEYFQELQMLTSENNFIDNSQSLLNKCIYLTENSYVHLIIQNLMTDFQTVSNIIEPNYKINFQQNEGMNQEKETIQQTPDLDSQRKVRTLTCFSRSSATTQHINVLALASALSISNAQENSASQEIIKLENNQINQNTNNSLTEQANLKTQQEIDGTIQNYQLLNQKKLHLEEIPDIFQNTNENPTKLKQHQQEQCAGSFNITQKYDKNYMYKCKSFFKLKNLTQQQQMQFRFSQYKKRSASVSSPKPLNLNQKESPPDQSFKNICESQENQMVDKNLHKFGKYHNFNKLFMYNILNMFQPNNLANMNVPEQISKELQLLISKIKSSAKNNYKVEGKYAFDYFSHAHYNILFFKLNSKNIVILSQNEEYLNLYKECFNINLKESISSITITYINLIKLYCYQIFMQCIREEEIQIDTSLSQENLKNQYTLKVIRGIKKLSNGIIIKRF
ncbi:hypothetical protein TTHERM_00375190 (macronuclear) [Tetrahymena thermophila SB210]|uniref:Uncharacterized protein n=1 Tax=Tetrahymena thermophila (strain SB210) TaxID=312017 RepID=I7M754_TETTS|nr:hypothetical protein TTHERM_00375190 [Tetrahymena thermophila SB210]EAR89402.1 hypothetical protein TTHERM_00375190 [Tetrahymena thermophila SB210]|eukprot:XP_001009647.1 hypothetical protein TTHERM_00375190 [Tetrahymena thermophila SB210]